MAKRFIVSAFLTAFWLSAFCQQQSQFMESCFSYGGFTADTSTNINLGKHFIANVLKDRRFVLLGDQTHREGSVTSMKIKLVKLLHEEMGYNYLVFEDDFFSLYQLNQQIQKGNFSEDTQEYFSPIISENEEFQKLVDYLKESYEQGNPLFVLGFDSQIFNEDNDYLVSTLSQYLQLKDDPLTEEEQEFLKIEMAEVANFPHEGSPLADDDKDLQFDALMNKIKKATLSQSTEEDELFWKQVVFLMEQTFNWAREIKSGKEEPVQNFRDRMMAENFKFLANLYKDSKIIGWGASYHFASNLKHHGKSSVTDQFAKEMAKLQRQESAASIYDVLEEAVTMGDGLKETYGNLIYSLAFITGNGSYGLPDQSPIAVLPPPPGSIEHWLRDKDYSATWIDLSNGPGCQSFLASPLGHLPIYAPWHKVFDGFLYLPMVKPLTTRKPALTMAKASSIKMRGKVTDAHNNKAISFAHILVLNRANEGSATNESGDFEIAAELRKGDTLKISSLGYESVFLVMGTDALDGSKTLTVRLQPRSFLLDEVVVSAGAKITPEVLMKKVIANIKKNYPQKDVSLELFLRNKRFEENQLVDKKEVVLDYYSPNGYSVNAYDLRAYNNNHFANVKQVRNFNPERPMGMPYLDLMNLDIVGGTKDLLKLNKIKNYVLELEEMSTYDGNPVYVLSFIDKVTRPVKAYNYTSHFSGRLYINAENYGILKYEGLLERVLPDSPSKGDGSGKPLKVRPQKFEIQTTYQEHKGNYHLKTGKIIHTTNVVTQVRRSVVEFLTTAVEDEIEFSDMVRFTELPIHEPPYDPDFWKSYNIVIDE